MKCKTSKTMIGVVVCAFLCSLMTVQTLAQYQSTAPTTTAVITENPVKKALKEGKVVIGPAVTSASPDVAATLANAGYDYLWIEMEHSSLTLETVREMILATRGLRAMPFTRIPANEPWLAKRVMDSGSLGVIIPFVSTPAQAEQAVKACKYPPQGVRGYFPLLASARWGMSQADYVKFANDNVMVIVQIEDKQAVDNIEEIAAVPGIDVLFIGASDLSFSLGKNGAVDAAVEEAISKVLAAGKKHNLPVGFPAATSEGINKRIAQGFRFFLSGNDLNLMSAGARDVLSKIERDEAGRPKNTPGVKK